MKIKYTLSITGTVISFIPHPLAKGVGFGMRGTAVAIGQSGI